LIHRDFFEFIGVFACLGVISRQAVVQFERRQPPPPLGSSSVAAPEHSDGGSGRFSRFMLGVEKKVKKNMCFSVF
jgi:hypothetical protein